MFLRQVHSLQLRESQVLCHHLHHLVAQVPVLAYHRYEGLPTDAVHHAIFKRAGIRVIRFSRNAGTVAEDIIGLEQTDDLFLLTYTFFVYTYFPAKQHPHIFRRVSVVVDDIVFRIIDGLN